MDNAQLSILLENGNWMHRFARDLVRDPDIADDLVQDAWVAVVRHRPNASTAKPWLRAVLRNGARQHWRKESLRASEGEVEPQVDTAESSELAARAEMLHQVSAELLQLREPYRSTLLRRYFDGWGPKKIAEHMGVPVSTVKTRLQRGLEQLRETLDEEHGSRTAWAGLLIPFRPVQRATTTLTTHSFLTWLTATAAALLAVGLFIAHGRESSGDAAVAVDRVTTSHRERATVLTPEASTKRIPRSPLGQEERSVPARVPLRGVGGTVVAHDGSPVEGAAVTIQAVRPEHRLTTHTDASGHYELNLQELFDLHPDANNASSWGALPPRNVDGLIIYREFPTVSVAPVGSLAGAGVEMSALPAGIRLQNFTLERATSVEVRVVEAGTGLPVEGVVVSARPFGGSARLRLDPTWNAVATSGSDGRLELSVGKREWMLLAAVAGATHDSAAASLVPVGDQEVLLELTPHAPHVRVKALNAETGEALVTATYSSLGSPTQRLGHGEVCDVDRRDLTNHPGVLVEAPGFVPIEVPLLGSERERTVTLQPTVEVEVEVLDGDSGTFGHDSILRWSWPGFAPNAPSVMGPAYSTALSPNGSAKVAIGLRDDRGVFVPSGVHLELVRPDGSTREFGRMSRAFDEQTRPRLLLDASPRTVPVTLRLVDRDGGVMAGAGIQVLSSLDNAVNEHESPLVPLVDIQGRTDESGLCNLHIPREAMQRSALHVYWSEGSMPLPPEAGDAVVELGSIWEGETLRGTLIGDGGDPATDAYIYVGYLDLKPLGGAHEDAKRARVTPGGIFENHGMAPGTYEIITPGFQSAFVRTGDPNNRVMAPRPMRLSVRIVENGSQQPVDWVGRATLTIGATEATALDPLLIVGSTTALPPLADVPSMITVNVPGFEPFIWTPPSGNATQSGSVLTMPLSRAR